MKLIFLISSVLISVVQCYKILMVFPVASRSHFILGNALGRGLANAGHEVLMLSPFEDKNPPKNYKDFVLTGFVQARKDNSFTVMDFGKMHPWLMIPALNMMGKQIVEETFKHSNFRTLLEEKFDVIILEQFKNDAMKVLQCHFETPLILFSTIGPSNWVNLDAANPSPPSYVPNLNLSYMSNMTFWQRMFNALTEFLELLNRYILFLPVQNELARQYFPKCTDRPLNNFSLILLNSHESSAESVPLVPSMINIGGFHVNPPKGLPKDLKDFMDNAKEGVVYFSMGSIVECSLMPKETKIVLVKVLGKLKQKVLWKCNEEIPELPDNVKLGKWFPQTDILAHPNTKLFITHGGSLSLTETIYHGVPILALPVFGDQKMNAAKAEAAGYGRTMWFTEITEESLTENLNKMLLDPKYRENVKSRSALMHDRPMKPLDLAIYWTEFIARHKGAPHLKVAAVNLTWYQYFLLDVILMVAVIIITIFAVFYFICSKILCFRKNKQKKD